MIKIQIISSLERDYSITEKFFLEKNNDIIKISEKNNKFCFEKINLEKERIKKENRKNQIDTILKITNYVGYSFSIVLGGAMLATNPILGISAIAGGTIGFVNSLLNDTKALEKISSLITKNKKYQKYINQGIEITGAISSTILSSTTIIINPSTVTTIFGNAAKIKELGETTLLITKAISGTTRNVMQEDVNKYERQISLIEKEQFDLNFKLDNTKEGLKDFFSQSQRINETVINIFQNKE